MQRFILWGLYLLLPISLIAQDIEKKTDSITIERLFRQGDFRSDFFGPHQWLGQGEFYTTIEYNEDGVNEIVLYDSKTTERSILVGSTNLTPEEHYGPLDISGYSWSNDEKKLLIFTNTERVWRTHTRGDYYVMDMETKLLKQIGKSLEPSSLMFTKYNPEGNQVAYVSKHNLYIEDLQKDQIVQLTFDGSDDIINGTFDWAYEEEFFCKDGFRWNPSGKFIAFWQIDASGIRDFEMINNIDSTYSFTIPVQYPKVGQAPSAAKVGVADLNTMKIEWLAFSEDPRSYYIPRIQWVSENELLVTRLNRKQNHLALWLYNRKTKKLKKIYEEQDEAWVDFLHMDVTSAWEMHDLALTQDGKSVLWITERDGWRHLYAIGLDGEGHQLLTPGDYDLASLKGINRDQKEIYFIASPKEATHRYLYKINMKGGTPTRVTPKFYHGLNNYDIAPNGKFAIHTFSQPDAPRAGYMIALPSHSVLDTLYDNEALRSKFANMDMPTVEFFQVTTKSGITMDGKMIKPKNFDKNKTYPVLFHVYGEPAGQTATDTMGNLWHFMLAQKGYIIITMDNRGVPSLKGREWRKSIYRKIGIINTKDQGEAAEEVLKWNFIDPNRVAVWGWSGGGSMTLNLLFKYPEIFKTGISIAAVSNQLFYDNIYQERFMGLPQENLQDFIDGSPYTHARNLQGNLLYIHGTADDNVHYQNAEYLIDELIRHNKKFDLMIYPNRSHGIYEGDNTVRHLYTTMTDYLVEHVPPGPKTIRP